jgi:hypothetical protein
MKSSTEPLQLEALSKTAGLTVAGLFKGPGLRVKKKNLQLGKHRIIINSMSSSSNSKGIPQVKKERPRAVEDLAK